MSLKKLIAVLLCVVMVGSVFAGCGQNGTNESTKEDAAQQEVVADAVDPISDLVNTEDDSQVNYETNLVTGGSGEDQAEEEEDWVTSLVDKNTSNKEEAEQGSSSERLPEDYVDEDGNLKVPFDIAYPDIFNSDEVQYADNAILVKVANAYSEETVAGLKDAGIGKMETMFGVDEDTWYTAYLLKGVDVHEAMDAVRQVSGIKIAEYNYAYEVADVEEEAIDVTEAEAEVADNPRVEEQSVLDNYGIKESWAFLRENTSVNGGIATGGGDKGIVVAVIDTGVDYNHVDLKANMWKNTGEIQGNGIDDDGNGIIDDYYGANFTAGGYYTAKGSGMDDHGHGTHVAGIVAASNNKAGVVGIAYNVQLMALKAGDASGYFLNNNVANAILYAYNNGADVINMSFGGTASTIAVQDALATAYARCILVASAGNNGAPNEGILAVPNYPAAFSYVLGVMSAGGTGKNVVESGFTNYDYMSYNSVEYEVYAPGEQILSTLPGDRYGRLSGTSMAAPVVAAQAALLRSYYTDRSMYPTKFIYGQIVGTADEGVACFNSILHGAHNIPGIVNFYDSFTDMPQPDVYLGEYTLFDTAEFSADTDGVLNDYLYEQDEDGNKVSVNDGDGVVDAGEVIALGFALHNRWGMSENTTVSIDATSDLGVEHPYVTILNNEGVENGSINYGSIGTYSEGDCGKIVENDAWVGWEKPFYLKVDKDCPNDYTITLKVTITTENALDENDGTVYKTEGSIVLTVRSGYVLPDIVREDMTLTKDNYYIIPDSMMIMEGATVTVEPGTYIQFWTNDPNDAYAEEAIVSLTVEGEFICKGTEEEPVKIFPSGWMDQYKVEIKESRKGMVSLTHTIVTNPYIEITRADNCEFNQNYKKQLRERYLSGSSVYNSSTITKIQIDYATDCGFYKLGGQYDASNYQAQLLGNYKRCIFIDSNINYNNNLLIEDCVFYGNNNYWDSTNEGATSKITVRTTVGTNAVVKDPFVYADNGSTYVVIQLDNTVNSIAKRFAKALGGNFAVFDTVEEAEFVLGNDTVDSYEQYYIGTIKEGDNFYNADGTVWDVENYGLTQMYNSSYGYSYLSTPDWKYILYNETGLEAMSAYSIVEIPGDIFVTDLTFEEFVIDMSIGDTASVNAIVTPATVDKEDLIYESQNENVVTVDESGNLIATGLGTTTVRVYAHDLAVSNSVTVNVTEVVKLESITVEYEYGIQLEYGTSERIKVAFEPVYTTERKLTYTSDDEGIIKVSEDGIVTSVGETGTANITVTAMNGMSIQIPITVVKSPESLYFEEDTHVISLSDSEQQRILPVITPSDATNQTLIWETSNPEVCTVTDDGYLLGIKEGTTTIKATLEGTELSDSIIVYVTATASDVKIKKLCWSYNSYAGGPFIYAVMEDKTAWVWGTHYKIPQQLPLDNVEDIYVHSGQLIVLHSDGYIRYYYSSTNSAKDLLNPTFYLKITVPNIVTLNDTVYNQGYSNTNYKNYYAIDADGVAWQGEADSNSLNPVNITEKVKKIVRQCGDEEVFFLTEDNTVYCYAENYYGTSPVNPEKLEYENVEDIYSVNQNYIAVKLKDVTYVRDKYFIHKYEDLPENSYMTGHFNYNFDEEEVYYYVDENKDLYTSLGKEEGVSNVCAVYNIEYPTFVRFVQTDDGIYVRGSGANYLTGIGTTDMLTSYVKLNFGLKENTNGLFLEDDGLPGTEAEDLSIGYTHIVEPKDTLVFDFNQALYIQNSAYDQISLHDDTSGYTLAVFKNTDLDKLTVTPRSALTDGHVYTITIPAGAFADHAGSKNGDIEFTFLYQVDLKSIAISNGTEVTMNVDDNLQLNVAYTPADTASRDVLYTSDDEEVLLVDETGLMHAVSEGTTVVTVTSKVEGVAPVQIAVNVVVPVETVAFGADVYEVPLVIPEETPEELPYTPYIPVVTPDNATNQNVIIESFNEDICTGEVDSETGELVKNAPGITVLKATVEGTDICDYMTVVITDEEYELPEDVLTLESWTHEEFTKEEVTTNYVYSNVGLTFDFNQVVSPGETFDAISFEASDGSIIPAAVTLDWDTVTVSLDEVLSDGETYTLTIPAKALAGWLTASNDEMKFVFTYAALGEREKKEDDTLLANRHFWSQSEMTGEWELFAKDGLNTSFTNNAILNRLDDDNVEKWLRFTAATNNYGTTGEQISLGGNYWGTANKDLIDKQIVDFNDYQTLYDLDEGKILTEAPEDTFPFVVNAYLEVNGESVNTVGNQEVTFVVKFNRDMDVSIPLEVRFGSSYPYSEYVIEGAYVTESEEDTGSKIWKGTVTLKTIIENGYQYWYIANGKSDANADVDGDGAADGTSLKLYTDMGRFEFKIDTTAAQALLMQAEPTTEGIKLTWQQDEFDTLAGYRVYRSDDLNGQYDPITTTVIPTDTMEWLDVNVTPGKTYYYTFTVVESDMTESEPAVKVMATAYDTMAPNIYHDPVYTAFTGNNLVISASIDDNLAVAGATLFYRTTGAEAWKSAAMSNYNDSYSAMIPAAEVTEAGIEYYIMATDGITETYAGTAEEPFEIIVQIAVSQSDKGDVDGDGAITLLDALRILLAINHRVILDSGSAEFARADIDSNGVLEAKDALRVLQYVNGTITSVLS